MQFWSKKDSRYSWKFGGPSGSTTKLIIHLDCNRCSASSGGALTPTVHHVTNLHKHNEGMEFNEWNSYDLMVGAFMAKLLFLLKICSKISKTEDLPVQRWP